ncbi:hypothetical protein LPC08_15900 [Roseomonas sp. OT10]|uniref:hypothetical protein n=1 Tax=Roseomonas cutis TaxID=2897332 RepID=UPI001E36C155|nr:hypothetical protein [Roseomonas sp. OT10]UFN47494.1 hypothetical protein LPC08_15900 [Roseomonas sp. OT10]
MLALLLVLQWGGGLWPHLQASFGAGDMAVICTPEGMKTLRLGADGKPLDAPGQGLDCCQLCQGPNLGGDLPAPAGLPAPREVQQPGTAVMAAVATLSFLPPPRTRHSRAPPLS